MSPLTSVTRKLLSLSMLKGIGPVALRKFATVPDLDAVSNDALAVMFPSHAAALTDSMQWISALDRVEDQVRQAESFDARIISGLDANYPASLLMTSDDPFLLFVRGELSPRPEKSVAVIGTRQPTQHGVEITKRVSNFLSEHGCSIVSGLAVGCDAAAHQAAVDVKGHTVAVLAHGLHTVAPKGNSRLADRILDAGGALISQYLFGVEPRPQNFVKRDRVQAGMASGVVMVQSDLKGGSLHASRAALDYGRWLAVPYPTNLDRGNEEPKIQANLLLTEGTDDSKVALLKCSFADLKRLRIIRGRDDYPMLLESRNFVAAPPSPVQSGLI